MNRTRPTVLVLSVLLALSAVGVMPVAADEASVRSDGLAPLHVTDDAIEGRYIVTLADDADPAGVIDAVDVVDATDHQVYEAVLTGFAADLSPQEVEDLRAHPEVVEIEQDGEVSIDAASWGLDRIDQRQLPLDGSFTTNGNGSGVTAYIIDTGLQANHPDFGGRAQNVYDAFGGDGNDCQGHGTHVGGTVAGSSYGVAPGAALRGVRVLDCGGSGSFSGIIAGVDWVAANASRPAVANLSLGGGFSSAVNRAVDDLAASGVFTAVAAGNESQSACNVSPASASGVVTVASSTRTDAHSGFSNWGGCVNVYAPGSDITSAWIGSSVRTISGTSMASPHVAGVGALYLQGNGGASHGTVANRITGNATSGVLSGVPSGTPNLLLYTANL